MSLEEVLHDLLIYGGVNVWMRDRVQELAFLYIAKDYFSEHFTIYRFVIVQNLITELCSDFLPCWLTTFDDCMDVKIIIVNRKQLISIMVLWKKHGRTLKLCIIDSHLLGQLSRHQLRVFHFHEIFL